MNGHRITSINQGSFCTPLLRSIFSYEQSNPGYAALSSSSKIDGYGFEVSGSFKSNDIETTHSLTVGSSSGVEVEWGLARHCHIRSVECTCERAKLRYGHDSMNTSCP